VTMFINGVAQVISGNVPAAEVASTRAPA